MLTDRSSHRQWGVRKIKEVLEDYEVRPILFAGSGITQRYIEDAPSWNKLLEQLIEDCPDSYIEHPLNYYKQQYGNPRIGTEIADGYANWAWDVRDSGEFPDWTYEHENREIFLKHKVSERFEKLSPDSIEDFDKNIEEAKILQETGPHAIVTTNYDSILETIFPDEYNTIIGESIYSIDFTSIGEIFKIHGCMTQPESVVITEKDYTEFLAKKRYLTAKLLTYFAEHPVVVLGYDVTDRNVTTILEDLDQVTTNGEQDLVGNIFHINFSRGIEDGDDPQRYRVVSHEDGGRTRIRSISAEDYSWIYEATAHESEMSSVKVKHLRDLVHNTYEVVTEDAPRKEVQIEILQQASDEDEFTTMMGIAPMDDDSETADLVTEYLIEQKRAEAAENSEDLQTRLELATLTWAGDPRQTLNSEQRILEFRQNREQLEFNNDRCKLLILSSFKEGFQGVDWLKRYEGDVVEFLQEVAESTDQYQTAQRLELLLYILGNEDVLEILSENPDIQEYNLKYEEFLEDIAKPIDERVKDYSSSNVIHSSVGQYSYDELLGDEETTNRVLDSLTDVLLDDTGVEIQQASPKMYFRMAEVVKIANELDEEM